MVFKIWGTLGGKGSYRRCSLHGKIFFHDFRRTVADNQDISGEVFALLEDPGDFNDLFFCSMRGQEHRGIFFSQSVSRVEFCRTVEISSDPHGDIVGTGDRGIFAIDFCFGVFAVFCTEFPVSGVMILETFKERSDSAETGTEIHMLIGRDIVMNQIAVMRVERIDFYFDPDIGKTGGKSGQFITHISVMPAGNDIGTVMKPAGKTVIGAFFVTGSHGKTAHKDPVFRLITPGVFGIVAGSPHKNRSISGKGEKTLLFYIVFMPAVQHSIEDFIRAEYRGVVFTVISGDIYASLPVWGTETK